MHELSLLELPELEQPPHWEPKNSKPERKERSDDGKWKSFARTPNLLQYLPSKQFYGRVRVNGRLIRQKLGTTKHTTALLKLNDFLARHRAKKHVTGPAETFAQAQQLYEQDLDADYTMGDRSKQWRRVCIKKINATWPELATIKISKIVATDCRDWAARLASQVSPNYFNNLLDAFRLILKRAGITPVDDPSRDIKKLGVQPARPELPELGQFLKILEVIQTSGAAQARNCADLVRFLAFSGCRISEAKQVTWGDVDLAKGTMKVRCAKRRKTGRESRDRFVPIIPEMRELLERLNERPHAPEERVCKVAECGRALARASKLVGLRKRLNHHALRHFFTTRCIESGVDIPTVSRWLGHSDGGALLMRVYGHLRQEHSIQMAQKVTFSTGELRGQKSAKH